VNTPLLLYDGDCDFCVRWVARLARLDPEGRVRPLRAQERHTVAGIPPLSDQALDRAIHLVLPGGAVLTGARALPEILRLLPRWRWAAPLFRVPGVQPLADRVYAWVAARRHRLGCGPKGCGQG
jgi:lipase maturation factor 1